METRLVSLANVYATAISREISSHKNLQKQSHIDYLCNERKGKNRTGQNIFFLGGRGGENLGLKEILCSERNFCNHETCFPNSLAVFFFLSETYRDDMPLFLACK